MGDNSGEKLTLDFLKFIMNNLFWRRRWFRKWVINIPTWMLIAIPVFGADAYLINFYVSLYSFTLVLSLSDASKILDDEIDEIKGYNVSKFGKKLTAKKAAY